MKNISVSGHWNDGGFLARAVIQFEVFPSLIEQDSTTAQTFRVTKEYLEPESEPRAIFGALYLALKEMSLVVHQYGDEIVNSGKLSVGRYNTETGGKNYSDIPFEEISI